jgi:hypothetical protein
VERCKQVALMVGEGRDVYAECAYCHGHVRLWEALFAQQISGILAHLSCPEEMLSAVVGEAAPDPEFDYAGFIAAVEARMDAAEERPAAQAGMVELKETEPTPANPHDSPQ